MSLTETLLSRIMIQPSPAHPIQAHYITSSSFRSPTTAAATMLQVMVVARNFMDMVAALPAAKPDTLYDSAFICQAVLRSLPPLAKRYALQMLYVPASTMLDWVLEDYAAKHRVAIDKLLQLRVFLEVHDRDGEAPKLTENGFQFLLVETNAQLWYIMREYISSAEQLERGVDPMELISFLLELSFHTLGEVTRTAFSGRACKASEGIKSTVVF